MTIDCLDAIADFIADEFEDDDIKELLKTPLWNGRELEYLTRSIEREFLLAYIQSLANQAEFQNAEDEEWDIELLELTEEEDYLFESGEEICHPTYSEFERNNACSLQENLHVAGLIKKAKKHIKKVVKEVAHTAKKVAKFIEEHKTEILIAVAVIAVAAAATVAIAALATTSVGDLAGAAVAGAVAASAAEATPRRRENDLIDPAPSPDNIVAFNESIGNPSTFSFAGPPVTTASPDLSFNFNKERNYTSNSIPSFLQSVWGSIKGGLDRIGNNVLTPDMQDPSMPVTLFMTPSEIQKLQTFDTQLTPFQSESIWNGIKSGLEPQIPLPSEVDKPSESSLWQSIKNAGSKLMSFLPPKEKFFKENSECFQIEGTPQIGQKITWINGMANTMEESQQSAKYLQSLGLTLPLDGIYNRSHGCVVDFLECQFVNHHGHSPVVADLLQSQWTDFHLNNMDRPNAKILHFCHSQGAIHTFNALTNLPYEIQQRVIVVAIAPAKIIPEKICFDSNNYASKLDPVHTSENLRFMWDTNHYTDEFREELYLHFLEYKEELIFLDPAIEIKGIFDRWTKFDHEFQSPTFKTEIERIIKDYNRHNGEYS